MLQDFQWDEGDTISDLIGIRRVDSKDIVYENKKKTTKVSTLQSAIAASSVSCASLTSCVQLNYCRAQWNGSICVESGSRLLGGSGSGSRFYDKNVPVRRV